jgi:hypothetical protein
MNFFIITATIIFLSGHLLSVKLYIVQLDRIQYIVRQYPVRHYQVRKFPVRQDPARQYPVRHYLVRQYPVRHYLVRQYPVRHFLVRQYPVRHYLVRQYPVRQDPARQCPVRKYIENIEKMLKIIILKWPYPPGQWPTVKWSTNIILKAWNQRNVSDKLSSSQTMNKHIKCAKVRMT